MVSLVEQDDEAYGQTTWTDIRIPGNDCMIHEVDFVPGWNGTASSSAGTWSVSLNNAMLRTGLALSATRISLITSTAHVPRDCRNVQQTYLTEVRECRSSRKCIAAPCTALSVRRCMHLATRLYGMRVRAYRYCSEIASPQQQRLWAGATSFAFKRLGFRASASSKMQARRGALVMVRSMECGMHLGEGHDAMHAACAHALATSARLRALLCIIACALSRLLSLYVCDAQSQPLRQLYIAVPRRGATAYTPHRCPLRS
eukprot:IDg10616t1